MANWRTCIISAATTAIAALALGYILSSVALASEHAGAPITSWEDLALGLWHVVAEYAGGPAVVAFLMAQFRAMFPMLGNLGVFTVLGDLIAGNWGAAKNAK